MASSLQPTFYNRHLPSTGRLLPADYSFSRHISSNSDMSQPSSSSTFQAIFNTALQDYKDKTGSSLVDHPFAKQFQECDSVESITTILEEQARIFREFRDHGKLVNSLKCLVNILCSPFFTTVLDKGVGLLVCLKKHSLVYPVEDGYSTAIPASKSNICWLRHLTRRMSLFPRSHPHISLTYGFPRRPKKCVLAMTHWLTFSRPSRTSSADSVFMPGIPPTQP
jgi:hypothetical protein